MPTEDRIRKHYKALKKTWDFSASNMGELILHLARRWEMSCADIKLIVGRKTRDWAKQPPGSYRIRQAATGVIHEYDNILPIQSPPRCCHCGGSATWGNHYRPGEKPQARLI